jgi:tungstate transport system substrate-binding protein
MAARALMNIRRFGLMLAIAGPSLACGVGGLPATQTLTLATTTSVANCGLLDALLPRYRERTGTVVRVHQAGSGRALKMLEDGQADVAISHAPAREAAFLKRHSGWRYRKLMFNEFLIVGPSDDPARVRQARDVSDAMRRIASSQATFVSRGDESGTDEKELALWAVAETQPGRRTTTGQGMAVTLRVTATISGYTLTDRATFEQVGTQLGLVPVFEDAATLRNEYSLIVPPCTTDCAAAHAALSFATWLTEGEGRSLIASFRVGRGVVAFHPWPSPANQKPMR